MHLFYTSYPYNPHSMIFTNGKFINYYNFANKLNEEFKNAFTFPQYLKCAK